MRRVVRDETKIAMWLLGVATGVFLMIIDELINLSIYCGVRCQYSIPLIGSPPDSHHAHDTATGHNSSGINR